MAFIEEKVAEKVFASIGMTREELSDFTIGAVCEIEQDFEATYALTYVNAGATVYEGLHLPGLFVITDYKKCDADTDTSGNVIVVSGEAATDILNSQNLVFC